MSDEAFCSAVERVREYIQAGDAIQVVLSRRFRQRPTVCTPSWSIERFEG